MKGRVGCNNSFAEINVSELFLMLIPALSILNFGYISIIIYTAYFVRFIYLLINGIFIDNKNRLYQPDDGVSLFLKC